MAFTVPHWFGSEDQLPGAETRNAPISLSGTERVAYRRPACFGVDSRFRPPRSGGLFPGGVSIVVFTGAPEQATKGCRSGKSQMHRLPSKKEQSSSIVGARDMTLSKSSRIGNHLCPFGTCTAVKLGYAQVNVFSDFL